MAFQHCAELTVCKGIEEGKEEGWKKETEQESVTDKDAETDREGETETERSES